MAQVKCGVWPLLKVDCVFVEYVCLVTTGAIMNECARVLKANGAGEAWGLAVVRG